MSIKGFKSQQALKQKLAGYTEEQSIDQQRYVTVQEMNGRRHALDVLIHGCYQVGGVFTAASGSNIRTIKCTSHGANKNDIIRFVDGTQFAALSVPDANTIITTVELDSDPTGNTFTVWRHITPSYNSDGSLNVVATPGPIAYNRKSGGVTTATTVLEDLDTPANSRAMPVVLHGVDSASITITSGDLNISSSAANDSMRLGDGTNLTNVTTNNELKVKDVDAQTNFGLIADSAATTDTGSFSLLSFVKRGMQNWTSLLAKLPALVGGKIPVDASGTTLTVNTISGFALETTQVANGVLIGSVTETAPATDTASSGLNGRLQRIAQRLTSLIALFPTALGQGTMATSMKVVLPSDQSAIPASQSGTWNITNISGTVSLPTGAATQTTLAAISGQLPATLGIKTAATSLSIAPASDAIFNVKPKALTGSYAENLALTTVATFTAPANAIGAIVQADDANAASFRAKQGAVATATSGIQFQAGRSEKFESGSDISVCSEGASVKVYVQWFIQA